MEQRYLPIGSICTLKGKNKKVMITGYYSVEFKGNLTIKDYCGCAYPEGMLLPNLVCNFNHIDIEKIEFLGYKNNEHETFEKLLYGLTGNSSKEKTKKVHGKNDSYITSNNSYSKLEFDENGVVIIAEPLKREEELPISKLEFDKNGVVIAETNNNDISNPFYKKYVDKDEQQKKSKNWDILKNVKFDENGTVISTEMEEFKKENEKSLANIKFNEDGIVVSDLDTEYSNEPLYKGIENHNNEYNDSESNIKFNENGIVVSDTNKPISNRRSENENKDYKKETSNICFNEDGIVISEEKNDSYKKSNGIVFDKNGVVVSTD